MGFRNYSSEDLMIEAALPGDSLSPLSRDTVERHIRGQTADQVRSLQVELAEGRIRVWGFTTRYYIKQLVQAALRGLHPALPFDLHIEVV
jgi:hypothetical protein